MDRNEIIERLEEIAKHAVHTAGEKRFVMSLDDGIALHEAIDILKKPEVLAHGEGELSAQPEHICVNCGRTVNNGGWYEDGRTRCPIEEHYALPKDGYCHLWEKRKVWEDGYVKRPEEGEK